MPSFYAWSFDSVITFNLSIKEPECLKTEAEAPDPSVNRDMHKDSDKNFELHSDSAVLITSTEKQKKNVRNAKASSVSHKK